MLFDCCNFKIIGDNDKLILIATNENKSQSGYIIHSPLMKSLNFTSDMIDLSSLGRPREFITGLQHVDLELCFGRFEVVQGENLEKIYSPIMKCSINELLSVVDDKLNNR